MTAFDTGRAYWHTYRNANYGSNTNSDEYENPFDPGCTDYENFWDGWSQERSGS